MNTTVLIAGGTGLIGARLSELLTERRYRVIHLSRTRNLNAKYPAYAWDLDKMEVEEEAVREADFVVNLAGAGIADKPWTQARKEVIIQSRVKANELLLKAFEASDHQPKAFLSASAIGYYGDRGEEWVDEESAPGRGFLSESVQIWEQPIKKAMGSNLRTFAPRIGLVLSTRGGALPKFRLPLLFFIGTYFGNGRQWYSWIHIDDLCRMFIHAIENDQLNGIYNAVASQPLRNKDFTDRLGKAFGRPYLLLPAPALILRLFLGEMADTVLGSTRVSNEKIKETGFSFEFEDLERAVKHLREKKI